MHLMSSVSCNKIQAQCKMIDSGLDPTNVTKKRILGALEETQLGALMGQGKRTGSLPRKTRRKGSHDQVHVESPDTDNALDLLPWEPAFSNEEAEEDEEDVELHPGGQDYVHVEEREGQSSRQAMSDFKEYVKYSMDNREPLSKQEVTAVKIMHMLQKKQHWTLMTV